MYRNENKKQNNNNESKKFLRSFLHFSQISFADSKPRFGYSVVYCDKETADGSLLPFFYIFDTIPSKQPRMLAFNIGDIRWVELDERDLSANLNKKGRLLIIILPRRNPIDIISFTGVSVDDMDNYKQNQVPSLCHGQS